MTLNFLFYYMLFLSYRIQRMLTTELIYIFLDEFLKPRRLILKRNNLSISCVADLILILQMNLYHEIIHAKDVGQTIILVRMQGMHGIANTNICKLRFMKITFIPGITIIQFVFECFISFLCSPNKIAKSAIQDRIHLITPSTHQLILQMNHILEIRAIIIIVLEFHHGIIISILKSQDSFHLITIAVIYLIRRMKQGAPHVPALGITFLGQFEELIVLIAKSLYLGRSRMKHHLIQYHISHPKQQLDDIMFAFTHVT